MKFSATLIALIAGTVTAIPLANSEGWTDAGDNKPAQPTTSAKDEWSPAPTSIPKHQNPPQHPSTAAPTNWVNQPVPTKDVKEKAKTMDSPPKAAFSAPAKDLGDKLGNAPSESCPWDFVLSCAHQAAAQAGPCLDVLAKGSDNCFSDTTCAAAIGTDAPTCATCYTTVGKQKFVTAVYDEKSNEDVQPIFEALVSHGVCDSNGQVVKS